MEPRLFIRSGFAASAIVHLSAIAVMLVFAEVHPFGSVTAEPIAVDIVTPEEAKEAVKPPEPAPVPKPSDSLDLSSKPEAPSPPQPAAPPAAATPQKQAALSPQRPGRKQPAAQPQAAAQPPQTPAQPPPVAAQAPQPATQPPQPASSPSPAYTPPEPDLTVKYGVNIGLPPPIQPQDKPGDGFDAPATKGADLASSVVAEFRRHLKTCSKLADSVAPSDNVRIKLRVRMAPDGKLAAEPILIEASASAKGPALMQSAIEALEACQPYAMLPVDRYGEWRVLDLTFTPQDFAGAS